MSSIDVHGSSSCSVFARFTALPGIISDTTHARDPDRAEARRCARPIAILTAKSKTRSSLSGPFLASYGRVAAHSPCTVARQSASVGFTVQLTLRMCTRSVAEEPRRLVDDGLAPHELLDGEACDGEHGEAAMLDLGVEIVPLSCGPLLLEQAERVKADVARHVLRRLLEPRPEHVVRAARLRVRGASRREEQEKGDGGVVQSAVEEGGRAAACRAERPRVDQLRERPADCGQHRQAPVLYLRLPHPVDAELLLVGWYL
mmetsp:Transcript_32003/g.54704  ORF Transcript_32003/g.54704 Transcript_32003/m.54704 type:complete len:259 (+) Transcript_32003:183-959(+)